jgi:hypothetical protein
MASVDILLANRRRSPGNDDFKKMRDEVRARNLLLQCSMFNVQCSMFND